MLYKEEKLKNISFPLGGIGTGCIGLAGNGELKDWEIFNRPNKCSKNGYSHFAIKASYEGKSTVKVLHGDMTDSLIGTPSAKLGRGFGYGPREDSLAGFPHFKTVTFDGAFPTAKLTFSDDEFPATVRLCAFNPFIPHDEFHSSIPAAFFEWEIENTADQTVQFALACTVCNPAEATLNEKISEGNTKGVLLKSADISNTEVGYSDLCILTDNADTVAQEYWYRGKFKDSCTTYWKNLLLLDRMPERSYSEPFEKDNGTSVS